MNEVIYCVACEQVITDIERAVEVSTLVFCVDCVQACDDNTEPIEHEYVQGELLDE